MASGDDDMVEGSFSSLLIDSLKSNQTGDDLSPEDISWIDSCLVKDPDTADNDWTSMKDALIEILGLQPETVTPHNSTNIKKLHSAKPGIDKCVKTNDDSAINEEMETVNGEVPVEKVNDCTLSQHFQGDISEISFGNAFLPHYRKDTQVTGESISLGNDAVSSSPLGIEPITQDIFKVWDLGIPPEDDYLSKQLSKALSESSDRIAPSTIDDSRALNDLKEQSVDDLIAGLADLSLNQQSN